MRDKMPKNPGKSSCSNGNHPGVTVSGDAFLPPICVNKLDSGDNASEEDEVDDGTDMPAPSGDVPRKLRRTKHKHHHHHPPHINRCTNKSSMSDSFVLPLIGLGGTGSKRDPGWRENRAATHPDRKNERRHNGIPISKSCPILGRHRYNAIDYDDDFESDDEDSDTDTDFKSMSFNVGSSGGAMSNRSRLKDKNFNLTDHQDEMTSGVLCKLAKLESPRRVDSMDQLLHNASSNNTPSSCGGTKLPNIFKPKSDSDVTKVDHIARKSLLEKYENAEQLAIDTRTRTKPTGATAVKRLPESSRLLESRSTQSWKMGGSSSSSTTSSANSSISDSSKTLVSSSPRLLRSQDHRNLPQDDLPTETSVNATAAARNAKSKRKHKRRHEKTSVEFSSKHIDVDEAVDADGEMSESATPSDDKCKQWLNESDENGSLPEIQKTSQEPQEDIK